MTFTFHKKFWTMMPLCGVSIKALWTPIHGWWHQLAVSVSTKSHRFLRLCHVACLVGGGAPDLKPYRGRHWHYDDEHPHDDITVGPGPFTAAPVPPFSPVTNPPLPTLETITMTMATTTTTPTTITTTTVRFLVLQPYYHRLLLYCLFL